MSLFDIDEEECPDTKEWACKHLIAGPYHKMNTKAVVYSLTLPLPRHTPQVSLKKPKHPVPPHRPHMIMVPAFFDRATLPQLRHTPRTIKLPHL